RSRSGSCGTSCPTSPSATACVWSSCAGTASSASSTSSAASGASPGTEPGASGRGARTRAAELPLLVDGARQYLCSAVWPDGVQLAPELIGELLGRGGGGDARGRRFVEYPKRRGEDTARPIPIEVAQHRRIRRQGAVLLVGTVDDPHAVGDEVRDVDDAAGDQPLIVGPVVEELIVCGTAHDAAGQPGNRLGVEDAAERIRREDVARFGENRQIVRLDPPELQAIVRAARAQRLEPR